MEFLLAVYVPIDAVDTVKTALFNAGAGSYQHYDQCCWQTQGQGQFRPLDDANPAIGQHQRVETVNEIKLEMICRKDKIKHIIAALKQSHPYEEPAYHVLALHPLETL